MYHAKQDRRGDYINLSSKEMALKREIDAQNYLLDEKIINLYKIPESETLITKANLERYIKLLEEYYEGI